MAKNTKNTNASANQEIFVVSLADMVEKANAVDGAHFTEIPVEISAKMEEENSARKAEICKYFASLEKADFISKFFAVEIEKGLEEKAVEKAVKTAVSYSAFVLTINDGGLLELTEEKKPVSFKDIFGARVALNAFAHTDKKPKEDRVNANAHFFGDLGLGYLGLIIHTARKFTNIAEKVDFETNASYKKTFGAVADMCEKAKKQNPFEKDTNTGYCEQMAFLLDYFVGNTPVKLTAYHAKALFQMVCPRNKYGKQTIANEHAVFDAFAIIFRYAFNGYKLPISDKSAIYKI